MKTLLLLFISLVAYISVPADHLTEIKKKKAEIDQYELKHRNEIITLVKLDGKNKLIKPKTEDLPDDAEYVYNVVKDEAGHIVLIEQIPYSQSGDWYIEWKHYFDANGNTLCFSNRQSIFTDDVKGGVVVEETVNYYDADFKQIESKSRLTDKDDKTISRKKSEFDFRDYKYSMYKNVDECLKAFHIVLNQ